MLFFHLPIKFVFWTLKSQSVLIFFYVFTLSLPVTLICGLLYSVTQYTGHLFIFWWIFCCHFSLLRCKSASSTSLHSHSSTSTSKSNYSHKSSSSKKRICEIRKSVSLFASGSSYSYCTTSGVSFNKGLNPQPLIWWVNLPVIDRRHPEIK